MQSLQLASRAVLSMLFKLCCPWCTHAWYRSGMAAKRQDAVVGLVHSWIRSVAVGYRGPFYSSSGTELGSFSGGVPRITSTEVLQQVLPWHPLTPLMLSLISALRVVSR